MNEDQQPQSMSDEEYLRLLTSPQPTQEQQQEPKPKKKDASTSTGIHPIAGLFRAAQAAVRGVVRAGNEMSNTVVATGAAIDKHTGLYKLVNDDEGEKDFLDWYSKKTSEANPLQVPVGAHDTGIYGFVESATQFGAAMAGFSKVLKGAGMVEGAAHLVAGGLADAAAFDPYAERLSNLVQSAPSPIKNPLTKFLASDKDDPELLARAKAGLEGIMTGAAVDRLLHYVKAARVARMAKSGAMTSDEATPLISQSIKDAEEVTSTADHGPVHVVQDGPETFSLTLRDDLPPEIAKEAEHITKVPMQDEAQAERFGASINNAVKNESVPVNTLTGEQRSNILKIKDRIMSGVDPKDTQQLMDGLDFNYNYARTTPEDARAVINAISEEMHGDISKLTNRASEGRGQSHQQTLALADGLLDKSTPEEVVTAIHKAFGDTSDHPERVLATRIYMKGLAKQITGLSHAADLDPTNAVAAGELTKALDTLFEIHGDLAGTIANHARTLNALQIPVTGDMVEQGAKAIAKAEPEAVDRITDGMEPEDIRALARQFVMADENFDVADLIKLLKGTQAAATEPIKQGVLGRLRTGLQNFRTEMLLSGPKTQEVNFMNNFITAFQVPAENWWGGVISGNTGLRKESADAFMGNFMYLKDSFSAAKSAWKVADNVLDPVGKVSDLAPTTTPAGNWLNTFAHVPGRMLQTSDEFFKQMIYRSNVRAQSLRLAREQGIEDAGQLAQRVSEDMRSAFDPTGRGVNHKALDAARYTTFTNALNDGTFGKWLQDGANALPEIRFIAPFVRTPVNIIRFSIERTPGLALIQKTFREDLAAGGERRAIALGRQSAGVAMYSMGMHLAKAGHLTGGGPSNPELRKQWMNAGNQPYSIVVGGKQISYRRLEPFATPLALIADYHTAMGEMDEHDAEHVMTGLIASMTASVASKTFLQGISQTLDAISSGDPYTVHKWISDGITSFMPNAMRQTNPDPTYREVHTILDDVKSRTFGLSEQLEPRRNLFGEPVQKPPGYINRTFNPFISMKVPDDTVAQELFDLGKAMSMPDRKPHGLDYTDREAYDNGSHQSPYDRMMELMDKPKHGDNVRTALEKVMKSESWKNMSSGNDLYPGGAKWMIANKIIQAHQKAAEAQVFKEYPLLKQAYIGQIKGRAQSMIGGDSTKTENQLMNLIQQ